MTRSSLPRQIVFLVFAVLVAVLATLWISLYSVREAMDLDAADESQRRMSGRMNALQEEVSLIASDYHNWTDVFINVRDLDYDRLASNYGITAERGDVFQYAEMFDGPFPNSVAWIAGNGLAPQNGFIDIRTKNQLRKRVQELDFDERQTLNFFEFRDQNLITFSSSYLLPEDDDMLSDLRPEDQAIAVIGRILSEERLNKIANEFAMQNLEVVPSPSNKPDVVRLSVAGVFDEPVAWIEWRPPVPGTVLFWKMVPIMAAVSLLFVGASYWGARVLRDKASSLIAKEAVSFDQARTDVLTGLPNRFSLREHLEKVTLDREKNCAVLALDLDRFKQINDTVGHVGGDLFLETFGRRLARLIDENTFIARLGGDEFVLVFSAFSGLNEIVEAKCLELDSLCQRPISCSGVQFDVLTAKGLSLMQAIDMRAEELLRRADRAMYAAKTRGTQEVVSYDQDMESKDREFKVIETRLRRALADKDGFYIDYQPIVSADDREIGTRFEALARWYDKDLGQVSPEQFISVAENTGLIYKLGWHLLDLICRDIKQLGGCHVGVNVSPLQLMTPGFGNLFAARVAENGVTPDMIEVEVTEQIAVRDDVTIAQELKILREYGFRLALDDFGTGYSSIGYLTRMQFDVLKIDRSFGQLNGKNEQLLRIVRSIVSLAHSMDLKIVAEGIEEEEDAQIFNQLGCDFLQGYHIARPSSLSAFSEPKAGADVFEETGELTDFVPATL